MPHSLKRHSAGVPPADAYYQAYAYGKITLKEWPAPDLSKGGPKESIRSAPFFARAVSGASPATYPYTAASLGKFIGVLEPKRQEAPERLRVALDALELVEQGYLKESPLSGIGIVKLHDLVREKQGERAAPVHEAKEKERRAKEEEVRKKDEAVRKEAEKKLRERETEEKKLEAEVQAKREAAEKAEREAKEKERKAKKDEELSL